MKVTKFIVSSIVVLGLFSVGSIYWIVYAPNTSFEADEKVVFIETGTTKEKLLETLDPMLKNRSSFEFLAERKKYFSNTKPGRFVLQKGMGNNEIISVLRSSNSPINLVIAPFDRLEEVLGYVSRYIEADSTDLVAAFYDPDFLFQTQFRPENVMSLLIPNTYEVYWNTSAIQFRNRMLREYRAFWNANRSEKALVLKLSPAEVYTLASIVIKESPKEDEQSRVAGVYLNRLKKGMRLQADPTVVYAIKSSTSNFDTIIRRVLYRDLKLDSPYNTYKVDGLPVGPITMPDPKAIDAVLNAERHNYLFFVADTSRVGYHDFSETLSEHNKKRAVYTQWLNSRNIRR